MRRVLVVALLALPSYAAAGDHPNRDFALGFGALRGAAVACTEYGISHDFGYEANPLMRSRPVRVTFALAAVPVVAWATSRLDRSGHHGWARWTRRGVLALAAADAANDCLKVRR